MPIEELLPHFINASVQGIPLVAVVMAAVYWVKGLGVRGNALRITSLVIGLLLGIGYQLSALTGPLPAGMPAFAILFGIVFYGFALGLVASLLIDIGVDVLAKALSKLGVIALSSPLTSADLLAPLRASASDIPSSLGLSLTDADIAAIALRLYQAQLNIINSAGTPPAAQARPDSRA